MKNKEDQIARYNVSRLMRGEFDFNSEKILLYSILKKIIMDMMIDALNDKSNDKFYFEHPVG